MTIEPTRLAKGQMIFIYHKGETSGTKYIMPIEGVLEDWFITNATHYFREGDERMFYRERIDGDLRERGIEIGYKRRAIKPLDNYDIMVECKREEAEHMRLGRGKKSSFAHVESTWFEVVKWKDNSETAVYITDALVKKGLNPFFSFVGLENQLEMLEAKHKYASLIDVEYCMPTYYKKVPQVITAE